MKHPLCLNFKVLAQYDLTKLSIDEVVFFEWLVLKRNFFGDEKFFYQQQRVIDEIGIKRRRLTTIKAKFIDEYCLETETEGKQNITHFSVKNIFISNFVEENIKEEHKNDLLFRLLNFQFKGDVQNLTKAQESYVLQLINDLINIYNTAREQETERNQDRGLSHTELPHNKTTKMQLARLLKAYDFQSIKYSFKAFAESLIANQDHTYHVLNNFSTYKKENESFPVFERYLEIFNRKYSYLKA